MLDIGYILWRFWPVAVAALVIAAVAVLVGLPPLGEALRAGFAVP